MGYRHHWIEKKKPKKIPSNAFRIIQEIVQEEDECDIIQRDENDPRPAIVTPKEVIFNGVDEYGYETFYYFTKASKNPGAGWYFGDCKTDRRLYDEVVMKVLLVLKWALKDDFILYSDGSFEKEWKDVRKFMLEKYNITTYVRPTLETV